MAKAKVVVTGPVRPDVLAYLSREVEIRQWNESHPMDRNTLKEWLVDADGLWMRPSSALGPIDGDLVAGAKQLKVIAQAMVGYDNVVVPELTQAGIPYGYTPQVLTETVAELAFTLIATARRKIFENAAWVRDGSWASQGMAPLWGRDLSGTTLGIIGLGAIGSSIARRAQAFGMDVIYHNRHPRQDDTVTGAHYRELDELLAQADVVCIVAPLTDETYHMANEDFFKKMKSDALFVNVGRGKIVDQDALVKALQEGELDYAALDVTDPEPLPADHPLLQTGKCLIVPHIGSATDRTRKDMAMLTANNIIAGVVKKPLPACVNEEVNYK